MNLFGTQRRRGTAKQLQFFGVDENNVQMWQKHKALKASVRHHRNSLHRRRDDF
jgi:hypothetical protein